MSAGEVRGPLPPGWAWSTLGEVAESRSGVGFPLALQGRRDGSYPVIKVGDISRSVARSERQIQSAEFWVGDEDLEQLKARPIPPGSVLFAKIGEGIALNRRVLTARACLVDNNVMALVPGSVDSWYLLLWMKTVDLYPLANSTTVPSVRKSDVDSVLIPLPPLVEQRRIVAKLDAVMAQVREARAALEAVPALLEQYRRAVLAAAFRGELTADWRAAHPEVEPASALLARMPVLPRPPRYDSRSLAVVPGDYALSVGRPDLPAPEGWSWAPLVSIARLESGHTPSRSRPEWWGGDVPWIGIRDARTHHGGTIDTTEQTTNAEGLANSAARLLPAGTVCLSRTASVGYVVVMGRPMATSQDFVNWVCTEALDPHWLKCLFLAEHDAIWRFGKGSTHTTVYFPEVLSFHVCVPPLAEQHEIVRRVEAALGRIARVKEAVEAQRQQLDALERAVLDKAFRGALVPQHPDDEPAEAMLARLRAQRAAAGIAPKGRRGRPRGAGPEA